MEDNIEKDEKNVKIEHSENVKNGWGVDLYGDYKDEIDINGRLLYSSLHPADRSEISFTKINKIDPKDGVTKVFCYPTRMDLKAGKIAPNRHG